MLDSALVLLHSLDTESLVALERKLGGGPWLREVRIVLSIRAAFDHRVYANNWRVEFSLTPRAPYNS
jgi:hypothetical protein